MDNQLGQTSEKLPTRFDFKYVKFIVIILGLFVVGVAFLYQQGWLFKTKEDESKPLTWEECIKLSGSRVLQTYPAQCVVPDGRSVVEPIGVEDGIVEGTVRFIGAPCNPDTAGAGYKVPPCDGPYPNYDVVIYKEDKTTIAAKTTSDHQGNFKLVLPAGTYYFLYKSIGTKIRELTIVVKAGQTTQQNLTIDTGIR